MCRCVLTLIELVNSPMVVVHLIDNHVEADQDKGETDEENLKDVLGSDLKTGG